MARTPSAPRCGWPRRRAPSCRSSAPLRRTRRRRSAARARSSTVPCQPWRTAMRRVVRRRIVLVADATECRLCTGSGGAMAQARLAQPRPRSPTGATGIVASRTTAAVWIGGGALGGGVSGGGGGGSTRQRLRRPHDLERQRGSSSASRPKSARRYCRTRRPKPCAASTAISASERQLPARGAGALPPRQGPASASGTSCHCSGKRLSARCRRAEAARDAMKREAQVLAYSCDEKLTTPLLRWEIAESHSHMPRVSRRPAP